MINLDQNKIMRAINTVEKIAQLGGISGSNFLNTVRQYKDEMDYSTSYEELARLLLSGKN